MNVYPTTNVVTLQLAKWGNSLAFRVPSEYLKSAGLKQGDILEAALSVDGALIIRGKKWNRKKFSAELESARRSMPRGTSVISELREER